MDSKYKRYQSRNTQSDMLECKLTDVLLATEVFWVQRKLKFCSSSSYDGVKSQTGSRRLVVSTPPAEDIWQTQAEALLANVHKTRLNIDPRKPVDGSCITAQGVITSIHPNQYTAVGLNDHISWSINPTQNDCQAIPFAVLKLRHAAC